MTVVRRGEKYEYLQDMSFDARVLCPPECILRSSAAHAISISCMRTIVCSIRFAREMPRLPRAKSQGGEGRAEEIPTLSLLLSILVMCLSLPVSVTSSSFLTLAISVLAAEDIVPDPPLERITDHRMLVVREAIWHACRINDMNSFRPPTHSFPMDPERWTWPHGETARICPAICKKGFGACF